MHDQTPSEGSIHFEANHIVENHIDSQTSPYPYVISIWKLVILSITTGGLYELYWFYKQWKSFKVERGLKVTPWARALFSVIWSYSLFKEISKAERSMDQNSRGLNASGLAVAYFFLSILYKLPDPYWLLSLFSFFPLILAQEVINNYWEKKLGNKVIRSNFGKGNYAWTIIGAIIVILAVIGTFM